MKRFLISLFAIFALVASLCAQAKDVTIDWKYIGNTQPIDSQVIVVLGERIELEADVRQHVLKDQNPGEYLVTLEGCNDSGCGDSASEPYIVSGFIITVTITN